VLWWVWADTTGYTKKKAMEREDARRKARIDRTEEALGTQPKKNRR
jgi:small Trp-rich protein